MRPGYLFILLGTAILPWPRAPRSMATGSPHALDSGPLIKQLDSSTFRLFLPLPMAKLLEDSAPGFELWPWQHYDRDVRTVYVISHRTAPSAIIGDFNGDGVQDVVMEGHDRKRALRLCLLSHEVGFRLLILENHPWNPSALDPGTEISYLAFRAPGRIATNDNGEEVVLRTDAFERVIVDKGAILYYWNGTTFVEFQTAD
jgi:hypothetical protein